MFYPSLDEFRALSRKGNLVPVCREHLADLETPVSVLTRFAEDDYVFLLESIEGGERWGRYSFVGVNPDVIYTVGDRGLPETPGGPRQVRLTSFSEVREVMASTRPVSIPGLPRFFGGMVGSVSYETVNEFERLPEPKGEVNSPTCFMQADDLIIFDNVRHTINVVACARLADTESVDHAYHDACKRIKAVERRLKSPRPVLSSAAGDGTVPAMVSNVTRGDFCDAVRRAKDYIVAGDIIQVVLSQRFSTALTVAPVQLYRALRLINPSPYTFFMKFDKRILVGSSPEVMVRLTGNKAELRPIAGTRPRGATEQEDRRLADELLADEKERAEHVMLVDLGRNDLGRVAVPGSVQVRDFMTIERYSHVMHIVSHVQSELSPDKDAFDLIKATFPAGTLSGAPKVRAMEIIHELEPRPRGAYGGAVGYIGYDGNMDMAITIRTLEIDGDQVSVQAGAGIVADSVPETEYDETCHKASGMRRALALAARNFEAMDN
ncbi:MAG: anthranilate synthase component I [Lentisphaeria bacterium]|nr:anthranilate synthase component I [Lentisphaeria bacterium]